MSFLDTCAWYSIWILLNSWYLLVAKWIFNKSIQDIFQDIYAIIFKHMSGYPGIFSTLISMLDIYIRCCVNALQSSESDLVPSPLACHQAACALKCASGKYTLTGLAWRLVLSLATVFRVRVALRHPLGSLNVTLTWRHSTSSWIIRVQVADLQPAWALFKSNRIWLLPQPPWVTYWIGAWQTQTQNMSPGLRGGSAWNMNLSKWVQGLLVKRIDEAGSNQAVLLWLSLQ